MVLYASDFDQSKYLKAADLGEIGSEKRVKIKTVTKEIESARRRKRRRSCGSPTSTAGWLLEQDESAGSARRLW